jgi:hypothetical protein
MSEGHLVKVVPSEEFKRVKVCTLGWSHSDPTPLGSCTVYYELLRDT